MAHVLCVDAVRTLGAYEVSTTSMSLGTLTTNHAVHTAASGSVHVLVTGIGTALLGVAVYAHVYMTYEVYNL